MCLITINYDRKPNLSIFFTGSDQLLIITPGRTNFEIWGKKTHNF